MLDFKFHASLLSFASAICSLLPSGKANTDGVRTGISTALESQHSQRPCFVSGPKWPHSRQNHMNFIAPSRSAAVSGSAKQCQHLRPALEPIRHGSTKGIAVPHERRSSATHLAYAQNVLVGFAVLLCRLA